MKIKITPLRNVLRDDMIDAVRNNMRRSTALPQSRTWRDVFESIWHGLRYELLVCVGEYSEGDML